MADGNDRLPNDALTNLVLGTEDRVLEVARTRRLHIIAEIFPRLDLIRLDNRFYPTVRSLTRWEFRDELRDYQEQRVDLHLSMLLDKRYLNLHSAICTEFFTSLQELHSPHLRLLGGEFSEVLRRLMYKCDKRGIEWAALARRWARGLSDSDFIIWTLFLAKSSASEIVTRLEDRGLHQGEQLEDIERRILWLEDQFLNVLGAELDRSHVEPIKPKTIGGRNEGEW